MKNKNIKLVATIAIIIVAVLLVIKIALGFDEVSSFFENLNYSIANMLIRLGHIN